MSVRRVQPLIRPCSLLRSPRADRLTGKVEISQSGAVLDQPHDALVGQADVSQTLPILHYILFSGPESKHSLADMAQMQLVQIKAQSAYTHQRRIGERRAFAEIQAANLPRIEREMIHSSVGKARTP